MSASVGNAIRSSMASDSMLKGAPSYAGKFWSFQHWNASRNPCLLNVPGHPGAGMAPLVVPSCPTITHQLGTDMTRTVLFLLLTCASAGRSDLVTSSLVTNTLQASLDTGTLAGTRFSVSFSYDSSQVQPVGESYVQLNSFDFTLLGVPFTRQDIFQGGQVIFRDGVITDVTASFQVILPPNSPVQNITFGFGGPGVIGYIDLNGQFGSGSFLIGNTRVHVGTILSVRRVQSSDVLGGQPGIEIQLFSVGEFPVRDEIMVLQIGERQFFLSGYPNGDLNTVVFTLTEEEFAGVSSGEPVIIQYGIAPSDEVWQFGNLDKTILDQ